VKRIDLFLKGAGRIATQVPEARFVIAGDGSEGPRLRALAKSTGIDNRVAFLGHREDIYDILRAFDVFVLCSDHEGLPMALLEALYLGMGVVGRRVGGLGEVISNGVDGILVDSDDPESLAQACLELLSHPDRRERLAHAGSMNVMANFSSKNTTEETASLYRSLVGVQKN